MKACKPVTEKIKQSEVLRMKGTLKRVMSGVLSVITIASAVAQPMITALIMVLILTLRWIFPVLKESMMPK